MIKNGYIILLVIGSILAGLFIWNVTKVSFEGEHISHVSGFYKDPFTLFLKVKEKDKVYYTFDGSDPSKKNGFVYKHDEGININMSTSMEPSISMIPTTLSEFPKYNHSWKTPEHV